MPQRQGWHLVSDPPTWGLAKPQTSAEPNSWMDLLKSFNFKEAGPGKNFQALDSSGMFQHALWSSLAVPRLMQARNPAPLL